MPCKRWSLESQTQLTWGPLEESGSGRIKYSYSYRISLLLKRVTSPPSARPLVWISIPLWDHPCCVCPHTLFKSYAGCFFLSMWFLVNDQAMIRPRWICNHWQQGTFHCGWCKPGHFSIPTGFCRDSEHATQNRDVWSPYHKWLKKKVWQKSAFDNNLTLKLMSNRGPQNVIPWASIGPWDYIDYIRPLI